MFRPSLELDDERSELLHDSQRTRVWRVPLRAGTGAVIRKETAGQSAVRRLRHEAAILDRLAGVAGVPKRIAGLVPDNVLLLEDLGGQPLASTRLDLSVVPDLAWQLATIVAAVHRRGVVHKDINPSNVVLTDAGPELIDFDLATTFAEERPGFTHQSEIAGTLAYLAPEQTGRTGRPVDQRADLYALGATLYEVVTGRPPFGHATDGDTLSLIHDHLVRTPVPPVEVAPAVPTMLSAIIMRLLEKEPDRRYQSAEGLAHDLSLLCRKEGPGELGERDFPSRLSPPRPVGREPETTALTMAFTAAADGRTIGVLVSGAPGVGKTALVDELRPIVTAARGWFISGKFDQYRQDIDGDGVRLAVRGLAQLMLAEPEEELAALRRRIVDAVGVNAGLVAAAVPEMSALLGVGPETATGEVDNIERRLIQAGVDLMRGVASPARPLVMVLDDLQWAASTPLGFVDAMLRDDTIPGMLLIATYRDTDIDASHPLSAMLQRWRRLEPAPVHLHLANLRDADMTAMLAEMLRLPTERAAGLAAAIGARTSGNPYDTVELVNALRHDGELVLSDEGWTWRDDAIRRYVGHNDVTELLLGRIEQLPPETRRALSAMAYLGGEVGLDLLRSATGEDAAALEERLAPALEDGLLVMEHGGAATVRFRHDRVREAAYLRLEPDVRTALQLDLARRLAATPEHATLAAEQYLAALPLVREEDERRRVAALFHSGARHVRLANQALAERLLTAGVGLVDPGADAPLLMALETDRHAALCALGRLDEADELYRSIERHCPDPVELVPAAAQQMASLTSRARFGDALSIGLPLLPSLGVPVPEPQEIEAAIERGFDEIQRWSAEVGRDEAALARTVAGDLVRPEPAAWLPAARVIADAGAAGYFSDPVVLAWLTVQSHQLWTAHGPCGPLLVVLCGTGQVMIVRRGDYRTGYPVALRAVRLGEARGYEPATSRARFCYAAFCLPWQEPVEEGPPHLRQARERLLAHGDMSFACYCYTATFPLLLESAPTLDECLIEAEGGLALAARSGNDNLSGTLLSFRQLVRALRGETVTGGSLTDADFDEAEAAAAAAGNPAATFNLNAAQALAAALFGRMAAAAGHVDVAEGLLAVIAGTYVETWVRLVRGITLAERLQSAPAADRDTLLDDLDRCRAWFAARAADIPANFAQLSLLLDAERAAATGDFPAAVRLYDNALTAALARQRPWHRAFISERAGRFHLEQGLLHSGRALLAQARQEYEGWGAAGKTRQLDEQFPFLRGTHAAPAATTASVHSLSVSSDTIDLLGVLEAAQTLSSETNLDRLHTRVVEVLSALTGATTVQILLWNDDARQWYLPGLSGAPSMSDDVAAWSEVIPVSALRYVERTAEPLVVDDTAQDSRFAHDPYLATAGHCALLVAPIVSHGERRAMLVLENRLSRGAFTADRLGALMLIAGQLAVSFDNALAERFRSLVQRSSDLILVCDRSGKLSYVSGASADVLGMDQSKLIGVPMTDLADPADHAALLDRLNQAGAGPATPPATEPLQCQVLHADRSTRTVEVSFTDLTADPAVAGVMLHLRDVTARRRLELELQHAQKLESVGRLAAGIAHEINTPIQFVGDNIRFLRESFGDLLELCHAAAAATTAAPADRLTALDRLAGQVAQLDLDFVVEEVPQAIDQTLDGVQRVATIVRAMKAFGYTDNEQRSMANINEAIASTLVVATSETKYCADVETDFGDLPPVPCYIGDINQVILNLVVNAAHAIIAADRGRGVIRLATRVDGDHVVIDVTDTGTGIPQNVADKVFDPFFTTKEVGTGTGQGLTLARSLVVDRHGGTLSFTTRPGAGTTFTMRLPTTVPAR